jgi:PAS domain S-box-containing protein
MSLLPSLGHDLEHTSGLLDACRSIADAQSVSALQRQVDRWLARAYAPAAWIIACTPHAADAPLIAMHSGAPDDLLPPMAVPLDVGSTMNGKLQLFFHNQRPTTIELIEQHEAVLSVLAHKLRHLCSQLQSLAQTAELLFMRSLLHGEHIVDRNLDTLASTLLEQLNVSSIHVLIDQVAPPGLSWGIASQRVRLDVSLEERHRLLFCVGTLFGEETRAHVLLRRKEIAALARQHDLPYLLPFQSLLLLPICMGDVLLGAVIVGEERSWTRQPIGPQVASVCGLLARAIAASITRNQWVAKLIARERSLHALIDALTDAVMTTQADVIVSWNRAAQDIFGYTADDVLGRALAEVLPGMPARLQVPGTEPRRAGDWTLHTTSGRDLHLSCSVTHVLSTGNATPTVLYVFKDVSQQHELEYLKDELLGSVSHELRTPLNGIYGFGRLLLDRPHMSDAMRQEALESLQGSIERMTRLTDDFIDVARARRHRLPLVLDAVNIEQVVRSAYREIKRRHAQHIVSLRVEKALPSVWGDSLRIKQILDNLAGNAAKYSAEGTRIRMDVRRRDNMIAISLRDDGIGIPSTALPRVWEAFYRADNSRGQRASGVGLGLSIVKSLVEAHNGSVSVRSAEGRGSTFTFTLPIIEQ